MTRNILNCFKLFICCAGYMEVSAPLSSFNVRVVVSIKLQNLIERFNTENERKLSTGFLEAEEPTLRAVCKRKR